MRINKQRKCIIKGYCKINFISVCFCFPLKVLKYCSKMSYLGNTSDLENEKLEFGRNRATNLVSKLQASKVSSEPKWSKKRNDDSDSESTNENFLTKGK